LSWKGIDPSGGPPSSDIAPEIAGAIEGLGRALAKVGRVDEATLIADRWRNGGPGLEAVFVNLMQAAIEAAPSASAIAADRLAHFGEIVVARRNAPVAASLGWMDYRSKDYDAAIGWFGKAINWSPQGRGDLAANQGLALSLQQTGHLAEAEEVAWKWLNESADMRAIYISSIVAELGRENAAFSPPRLTRFIGLVAAERSAVGAQALGWRRLKEGNCAYAAPWFRKAQAWSADAKEDVASARGLTLSLKAVGAYAQAEDVAYAWRDRDETLRALYIDIGVEELTSEAPVIPLSEARVRRLSERVVADRQTRGARALGWWRYRQAACGFGGNWLRLAVDWSDADKRDAKTDEGLGLTLRATGRLTEAANLAWPWVDKVALMKKLYIDVMVEALSRDNPPEPIDEPRLQAFVATIAPIQSPLGAQALGWYRYERHEYEEAARWFKNAVDWWPQQRHDLSKRLSAPVDDYQPVLAKLALVAEDYRRTPRAYPNSSALIGKSREAYVNTEEGFAKTQEGYALTLRGLGRLEEAEGIAWAWRDRWPSLRRLFIDIAGAELGRTEGPELSPDRLRRYVAAIEDDRSAAGATALAWRQYRLKALDSAVDWFGKALAWTKTSPPDPDLIEGYVAALQAASKFDQAQKVASMWRGASSRFNLIYLQSQLREMRAMQRSDQATAAKYAEIEKALDTERSGEGALSLAWLAYETNDYDRALAWFRHAADWGGEALAPKAKEGVALTLRALGRFEDLAEFGYRERAVAAVHDVYYGGMATWLTDDKPVRDVKPSARAAFEQVVAQDRNATCAQALGWGAALRRDWPEAQRWFAKAIAWSNFDPLATPSSPAPEQVKIVEGYAQALRNVGDLARAEDVAFGWRDASPAIAGLYLELVKQAMSEAAPLTLQRRSRLAAFAEGRHDIEAAAALGWRSYREKSWRDAVAWFEKASAWSPEEGPAPKIAEGYALSLRAAGRLADAESLAWRFARDSRDMMAIYVSAVVAELSDGKDLLDGPRLVRFTGLVEADHLAVGAEALGWRRLKGDNCVYAAPWFRKARTWTTAGSQDYSAARGLALSLKKIGAFREAEDLAWDGRERDPEMDSIYVDIAIDELTSQAPVAPVSEARVSRLAERVLAERHVRGARALGWWRYRQAGNGYGGDWLRLAIEWSQADKRDAKTDEGFGLTLRATGRLAEAESVAWRWVDQVPLMKKLYIDVMVEELSRDNPPEPIDETRLKRYVGAIAPIKSALGAQALGWYRLERGEYEDAALWFRNAIAWWPQQRWDRSKRLSAPVDDYKPLLGKLALLAADYRRTPLAYPNSSSLIGKSTEDYVNTEAGYAKTQEGYALTLRALGRAEEAEAIAWAWRDRWPSARTLFVDLAVAAFDHRDGPEISPQRMQHFLEAIEAERSAKGAAALAWRLYRGADFDKAGAWFAKAIDWSKTRPPERGLVEGYVLALQAAKKFDAAEAVAAKWRSASPELDLLYVQSELKRLGAAGGPGKLSAQQLSDIEVSLKQARSVDGALSLAWFAYEAHDFERALAWFQLGQAWGGEAVAAKAKEGVALSLLGLERYEDLAAFGYAERGVGTAIHDAYFAGMIAWLTSEKPLRQVKPQAKAEFAEVVAQEKSVQGAQALAWGALLRKDLLGARQAFENAIGWSGFDPSTGPSGSDATRTKLVEGYVQALRNGGDLARAEDIAFLWRDSSPTIAGLYLQAFTQELAAAADLSEARLARFAGVAEAKRSPQAAGALGWRAYRGKTYAAAIGWFEKSMAWSPDGKGDAKIDEGYALSLRAAGQLVQAEDFAFAHRAEARELRAAFVAAFSDQLLDEKLSPKLAPARLDRFAGIVEADRISAGASALGWRRLKDGPCGYSLGWFRKAIAWSDAGKGDGKLYSGYAQGLRGVGMFNQAEDAAFTWADRTKEARELYQNIVIEELTRQWPRVAMTETRIARFSGLVETDRSAAGAQALGWRRYMQAGAGYGGRWFELAAGWSPDRRGDAKLNEGYALTQRAVGRLARAEEIAYPWIERAPAMKKLYIDIAVEELSRDYPPEPLAEERVAAFAATFASIRSPLGAQALGWYRYARGEYEPAARWFEQALDWWPQRKPDAEQKLAVPVEDYQARLARLALRPEDYRRTPRAFPNSSLLIGHDTESYVDTEEGLAKTVEGFVRTLAALSRFEAAETLGFKWLERWPPMRQLLIDMAATELSGAAGRQISAERLSRFARLIEAGRSPIGAEALAWKAYDAKDYAEAARWFRSTFDWRAQDANPSLEVARAYADCLRNLKQYDEATKFVATWRERLPDLGALALSIDLDSLGALDPASPAAMARVKQIAAEVSAEKSANGAASLGWLASQRKEFPAAEAWFKKAIQWAAPGADPDAKALEGYARALQSEGRLSDFMRFADEWSQRSASLKPLFLEAAAQTFAAAAGSGEEIANDVLARAGRAFAEAHSVNGAQALAWQRIAAKDWVAAAAWFKAARDWAGAENEDPKTLEGLVIALRNLHRDDEAEALAYGGAQRDETLRGLYLEVVAERLTRKPPARTDAAALRRYAEVVLAAKSANGAQALGWYSYNASQYEAAAAWFGKALAFAPTEDAALGLAFAYRRLGDRERFVATIEAYRESYAKVAALAGGRRWTHEQRAALETGEAPLRRLRASLAKHEPDRSEPQNGDVASQNALGWRLLNQKRPVESAHAFDAALQSARGRQRQEAAYGRSLALLSAGEGPEAGRVAGAADLSERQRNEVGVQLLEVRAWAAYNGQRYAEALQWLARRKPYANETRELMRLRIWCLQKLGQNDAAEAIQADLDRQLTPY
jgi:Tfp pilus assembly protein PilF